MENTLVAIVIVAVLTFATVTLGRAALGSVDEIGVSWKAMERVAGERARTRLNVVGATTDGTGANVYLTLRNDGQSRIKDFVDMDVIVQYSQASGAYQLAWLPFVEASPSNNSWTVSAISPDLFEPGVLNPGEEMTIHAKVNPPIGPNTTNRATMATPNGISVSTYFTR